MTGNLSFCRTSLNFENVLHLRLPYVNSKHLTF